MRTLVCGIRHRQAGIDIRETVALRENELATVLQTLDLPGVVALSTCNRTEFYIVADNVPAARQAVLRVLEQIKGVAVETIQPYLFTLVDEDAVLHLMRVASGLDSLIIGEGQILNQVKDAYQLAKRQDTLHPILERWFQQALTVGKRVRTETGIARKDVSVSRAAYNRVRQLLPDLFEKHITLIGGGKMATLLMGAFKTALPEGDRGRITLVNRSELRLQELKAAYGFKGVGWDQAHAVMATSDVVFVATGAPHVLFTPEDFNDGRPRVVVDVSVPRNVDPAIGELPNITLINTDDLKGDTPLSEQDQEQLLTDAQRIILEEYQAFYQWRLSLSAVPMITRLRDRVETIRQRHIAPHADNEPLDQVSRRLVNSLLHTPLANLRQVDSPETMNHHLALMDRLFDLNDDAQVG